MASTRLAAARATALALGVNGGRVALDRYLSGSRSDTDRVAA